MTEQTRRNILRYGIAIDLVILATGVAMIVPATAPLLVGIFAFASALSVWRGGWSGGLVALLLSAVALVALFPGTIAPAHFLTFLALGTAGGAAVWYATRTRTVLQPAVAAAPAAAPVVVEERETEETTFADKPLERGSLAEVVPLRGLQPVAAPVEPSPADDDVAPAAPPLAGPQKKTRKQHRRAEAEARQREEVERQRIARELEERLTHEREQAERIAAEAHEEARRAEEAGRIAAEARAHAEEEARQREQEERQRIARELEERLTREREEAERLATETRARAEAAARKRENEERRRIARELEERMSREREEAQRQLAERLEEERQAAELEQQRVEAARREAEEARRRAEEERERIARELEERLAREHEEAQRALAESLEEERRAAELERQRLEAERRAVDDERQRAEAARREAEEARRRAEEERERIARELEERLAREREEAERLAAEARARAEAEARAREEEERQRIARDLEERLAREREEAERALAARLEEERRTAELERQRIEAERRAAEEERQRVEAAHREAEEARRRAEEERERLARELDERVAREREEHERTMRERLEAERKAAEEDLRRQLDREREAMRARAEQELAAEREKLEKEAAGRRAAAKKSLEPPKPSLVDTISGWFRREPRTRTVSLSTKRVAPGGNTTATRRPQPAGTATKRAAAAAATKPRVLFIERRRATADIAMAKLRQRNVDVEVVERWVDAVDEIFRFRPNVLFLDHEHPEFDKIHRTISDKSSQLPLVITGRSTMSAPAGLRYAAFVPRPYDVDEVVRIAGLAFGRPEDLLAEQLMPRSAPPKPAAAAARAARPMPAPAPEPPPPPAAAKPAPAPAPRPAPLVPLAPSATEAYEVTCFSCRSEFDAVDADWCSCLTKERTLVCTNCLTCFCKAPPAYKEKFWVEAPPRLFERKTNEARRQEALLPPNPPKEEVVRPLVLCVEDDEEIQAIVQRVCTNLGYGFVWSNNGQDGLEIARDYKPNLILSDAFMPKLDGREMCRQLKEEGADCRMIVMTGLYTDTKYRSEAVKRFHVDDYIAKPVAVTDLVNLLQKHLEGVTGLPLQEDLHELHRRELDEDAGGESLPDELPETTEQDVPLADILEAVPVPARPAAPARAGRDSYDVCCYNCQLTFDATRAEWCSCVGRDNTLLCEHCGGCFCKAPAPYRERFWIDAPPSLFERKMIGSKRHLSARSNPAPAEVKRPLILLVEDDENVQLIVRTVVSSMGFGFVVGANGQEGLSLAREYEPDLILSDAFMPKLDGREMCRLLKEDPTTARSKAIIMTGLYTDRKYRNEALDYFKVDDYVAKPLAVDDLIKLFKKHLPQEVTTAH